MDENENCLYVICIKENPKEPYFKLGGRYVIIDAEIYEYVTGTYGHKIYFSKNDIEHFKYHC